MSIKRIGKGFNFAGKVADFNRLKSTLPRIIANNSLNHFLEGFRTGGGQTDAGLWSRRRPGAPRDSGRAILIDTGALRRDIMVRRLTFNSIIIGTLHIPYARRHNEGIKMPKREFLGTSKTLDKKNKGIILAEINKVMK